MSRQSHVVSFNSCFDPFGADSEECRSADGKSFRQRVPARRSGHCLAFLNGHYRLLTGFAATPLAGGRGRSLPPVRSRLPV
jgi:hypothetical protein